MAKTAPKPRFDVDNLPKPKVETKVIHVVESRSSRVVLHLTGETPLIAQAFSDKRNFDDRSTDPERAGAKRSKEAINVDDGFNNSRYIERTHGWDGFPAAAFKAAMADSLRTYDGGGLPKSMTDMRQMLFVKPQGVATEDSPIVRIYGSKARPYNMYPQTKNGRNLSVGAIYDEWQVFITITYAPHLIKLETLISLCNHAGQIVGVGRRRMWTLKGNGGTNGAWNVTGQSATIEDMRKIVKVSA